MTDIWGTVPQWLTAGIALAAASIAFMSITVQRGIARKRATIDFFLKASMDKECLATYETFKTEAGKMKDIVFEEYIKTPEYKQVRVWLNICELISVGINRKVFDDRVAFDCWGDLLPWCFDESRPLIDKFREIEGSSLSFFDLETVSKHWKLVRKAYEDKAKERAKHAADVAS